ncbi:redox protein [Lyngbya confervoides]|uniref:Redox protein n=1 Tax=Lyngbya confervoides BDU141951 TaxID=1574623 RepID=A0ABD4T455_9CYAN|nr:redox protein [Lyngbya confervoides]MCM1983110.1 redox protein [Lyngbya confervoides BDU141951]
MNACTLYFDRHPKLVMYQLIPFHRFRETPQVRFFDITISHSNARDLVFHEGPATSPNNDESGAWQFYLHPHQEDNLMALSGGRTFYLVNFTWLNPFHIVRLEAGGDILQIPPGTFHRSVSDPDGSLVLNQAVRSQQATVEREFRVYNSAEIPRLKQLTQEMMNCVNLHQLGRSHHRAA